MRMQSWFDKLTMIAPETYDFANCHKVLDDDTGQCPYTPTLHTLAQLEIDTQDLAL